MKKQRIQFQMMFICYKIRQKANEIKQEKPLGVEYASSRRTPSAHGHCDTYPCAKLSIKMTYDLIKIEKSKILV